MSELVTVAYYYDMSDAFTAKSALEGNGFNPQLFGEALGSSWAFLGAGHPMRLVVPADEVEGAMEILAAAQSNKLD